MNFLYEIHHSNTCLFSAYLNDVFQRITMMTKIVAIVVGLIIVGLPREINNNNNINNMDCLLIYLH